MSTQPPRAQATHYHPYHNHHQRHLLIPYVYASAPPPTPIAPTTATSSTSHVFAIDFIMNPCESDHEADDEEPVTLTTTTITSLPPSLDSTSFSTASSPPPPSSIHNVSSSSRHMRRHSTSSTSSKTSKRNYQRHDKSKIAKLLEIYYDQKQSVRIAAKMVNIPRATAGRYIQKEKAMRAVASPSNKKHTDRAKHVNK